jgi:hypothetical protein
METSTTTIVSPQWYSDARVGLGAGTSTRVTGQLVRRGTFRQLDRLQVGIGVRDFLSLQPL